MKRIRIIILSIALLGALSCSSQYGPTENEAYAGAWIGAGQLSIEDVSEMTDTTFVNYSRYQGLNWFVPAYKGFLSYDETSSSLYVITTHIYELDNYTVDFGTGQILAESPNGYWVSAENSKSDFMDYNYRTSYIISVSGDTITFDDGSGPFPMTRTEPVSDSLLSE